MATTRLLNLGAILLTLIALVLLREGYENLTERLGIQKLFGQTLYHFLTAFFVVEAVKGTIFLFYKTSDPKRKKDNFTIGLNHISKVMYGLFGVALALSVFNISIHEALTTLSLIAAAVVLMTKDYISNLINGMYLTFARVITIGDQVMIDRHKGKIVDITLTNVQLLNEDDDVIFIPNNLVFSKEIINYTRRDLKKTTIEFEAQVDAISDIDEFEKEIISALEPFSQLIQPTSMALKTSHVKHESIGMKFQFILRDHLDRESEKKIRKFLIRWIVKRLAR